MNIICGMDEVGRGALAGPLVLAGVILPPDFYYQNIVIRDSKKMTLRQRIIANDFILKNALKIEIEIIEIEQINEHGIGWGNKQGFLNIVEKINASKYIVDGNLKFDNPKIESLIDADKTNISVMCASIVAKCFRDDLMKRLHLDFPDYNWDSNVGYGTKKHIETIKRIGICKHHRIQFVNTVLNNT